MRKLLPMPHGAALVVNDRALRVPEQAAPPPVAYTLGTRGSRLVREVQSRGGVIAKALLAAGRLVLGGVLSTSHGVRARHRADTPYPFREERTGWGMTSAALGVLREADVPRVVERRRRNFALLAGAVPRRDAFEPLLRELPDGACPWIYPILARDPSIATAHLASHGIPMPPFWQYHHPAFPAAKFPEDSDLKARMLALPLDQDLDARSLDRILSALATMPAR
jgi:hypothetical protein